ncbi:MAG: YigZ family protein [Muribaculaceae bacterium]|nr:YigZ family protein [Muribaculaceae bacterium]
MDDIYLTVASEGKDIYKEKMSKFIGFAIPVSDADEAKAEIKRIQNEYHDARHVCWAYMIGADRTQWQLNDNGEPSGTAGKPILGQINSAGVSDVVVVVVRYFGGIKLGTPGLTAAYREAARLAIAAAGTVERQLTRMLEITFPYPSTNEVMKVAKQPGITVLGQTFDCTCSMRLEVPLGRYEEVAGRLSSIDGTSLL